MSVLPQGFLQIMTVGEVRNLMQFKQAFIGNQRTETVTDKHKQSNSCKLPKTVKVQWVCMGDVAYIIEGNFCLNDIEPSSTCWLTSLNNN